ncbi:hypothetical protein K458DRAFT_355197 [Lentithecium fluviatile CBS 122367]|uniref:RING-type domain-containing protein n=1 Tax=Lentithecium fluviatile CBS 122367 TaxID=1168545 RepID=A0A6G1JKY0_9PLEO|nr:hypothetical protein K458DRAFT_355197 [Lentithecium fluviatile CBS 122367]
MDVIDNAPVCAVVVEGLRKRMPAEGGSSDQLDTVTLNLPESKSIYSLWNELYKNGYEFPASIHKPSIAYDCGATKLVLNPHEAVTVVADDQPTTKTRIRLNDMLIAHANAHHGKPLEFNIDNSGYDNPKRPTKGLRNTLGFNATFQRTPRMPDDNRLHQLPGTLGAYDLFNVESYTDRLPKDIKDAGGVFLPMWQREAMWINFDMASHKWAPKWAVRVYVGRINAVSGLRMDEEPEDSGGEVQQDYIVIPGQRWLDGICVAPGVVRQFVAMPLGSGYTVEGQKTSEEKYGGLQIEVIPELKPLLCKWLPDTDKYASDPREKSPKLGLHKPIDEWKTPAEAGFKIGDVLRCYQGPVDRREPVTIKDLLDTKGDTAWKAHYHDVTIPVHRSLTPDETKSRPALGWSGAWLGEVDRSAPRLALRNGAPARNSSPHTPSMAPPLYKTSNQDDGVTLGVSSSKTSVKMASRIMKADSQTSSITPATKAPQPKVEPEPQPSDEQVIDIDIETTNLKAMGLAAGGKLVQDIYKDPYPPKIWNYAAARTIYVHILDPLSCEKVTHMVPIPPPMDAKTYTEKGGQFYVVEEKVDERLEGGDFEGVKSVSQMDKQIGVTTEPEFDPMKPKQCTTCLIRLCDCIIRPCDHQFCNVCIKKLEKEGEPDPILARKDWKCPQCGQGVSHVAGFSAPMNLPGEEPLKMKVPVHVMEINDGRVGFRSVQKTRI